MQSVPQLSGEFPAVPSAWHALPDEVQLTLSREALRRAAETLADHAELLASEMEAGTLLDQGGPDALRLFAAVVRATNRDGFATVGTA
ncbi:hypothetical protein SAMN02745194_00393 [Roseomonas rosea]|uniref:Uncharacterized protein n=1 Tax=Muricoccus roseus TaxID=198092 RepID=A0A1M6B842_9PROT|nr:hypothetical protein [Roseomonas rosea]SHI44748.1 hypothetical protein SAMN02745194_00393 [Roseomonas rosea]